MGWMESQRLEAGKQACWEMRRSEQKWGKPTHWGSGIKKEKVFWRSKNWLKEGAFKKDYEIVPWVTGGAVLMWWTN